MDVKITLTISIFIFVDKRQTFPFGNFNHFSLYVHRTEVYGEWAALSQLDDKARITHLGI